MAGPVPRRLTFPRSARIKSPGDFARAKARGLRVISGCLIANVLHAAEGAPSRLGVVTGKKIGHAVARARARRLLRESFRLHQHELPRPVDLVLVARPSIAGRTFAQVEKDVLRVMGMVRADKPPAQ